MNKLVGLRGRIGTASCLSGNIQASTAAALKLKRYGESEDVVNNFPVACFPYRMRRARGRTKITVANAAKLLNKSRRTIERYIKHYRQKGIQFVIHGNIGKQMVQNLSTEVQ